MNNNYMTYDCLFLFFCLLVLFFGGGVGGSVQSQ